MVLSTCLASVGRVWVSSVRAQIPQRTIFALNRFDDLLVKVAPGFLPSSASLSRTSTCSPARAIRSPFSS